MILLISENFLSLYIITLSMYTITKDIIIENKNNTITTINRINSNDIVCKDIMFIKANIFNLFFKMFEK